VNSYGNGCAGPGGNLMLVPNSLPWTERTWSGTCSNLGPASLALAVWGPSQSSLPLPAILPIAGAGCLLLNDAVLLSGPSVPTAGQVSLQLPIPSDPLLSGATLNVQVAELEFDLGLNWTGLYTSNGITLTVGAL
jgi:hypothetical protein